jgi:hypothetical protein
MQLATIVLDYLQILILGIYTHGEAVLELAK